MNEPTEAPKPIDAPQIDDGLSIAAKAIELRAERLREIGAQTVPRDTTPEERAEIRDRQLQRIADARAGVVRKGVSEHGFSVGPRVTTEEPGTAAPEATR